MRKKTFVQKICALALTFAMVIGPAAYVRAEEPTRQNVKETAGADTPEMDGEIPGDVDDLGNETPTDSAGQPGQTGDPASEVLTVEQGETQEEQKPEESEKPTVPGQTGTPGWLLQGSDWYYYDASGAKAVGWRVIGGAWYYFDGENAEKPGLMLADTKKLIEGQTYFFSKTGSMETGWVWRPEGWYYTWSNGAQTDSWIQLGVNWYYLDPANAEYPGLMVANSKKILGNTTYFFDASGAMRTGWIQQEEGWYYSDSSSSVGWKNVGGAWYYLDPANAEYPGLMVDDEKKLIGSQTYFFDGSGRMLSGWVLRPEGWYYTQSSGAQIDAWVKVGSNWYYLDPANAEYPGLMISDSKKVLGNATYFFDASGAMRTGWVQQEEGWYYADSASSTGWKNIGGAWYYLDGSNTEYPGLMISDDKKNIDGSTYFFKASGAMLVGWVNRPEGRYYALSNGMLFTGWLKDGSLWYYLDGSNTEHPGLMLQNCEKEINGQMYTFTANGAMRAGWAQDAEGHWYYYHPDSGQKLSGWQLIGGGWYYLDPANNNQMLEGGWHVINGAQYYMYSSGEMARNWLNLNGEWYYLAGDGAMRTGWQLVGGTWYYMYSDGDGYGKPHGTMAKNTFIGSWYVQGNGMMLTAEQYNMFLRAQTQSSTTGYLLLVDCSACNVGVFTGRTGDWNLLYFWKCSPGAPRTPTPKGVYQVYTKGHYFDSGSARCYWYTAFYRDYYFHSVLYSKYNGGLSDGRLGMQLSHGCVRLDINCAKWLYDYIPIGTTVFTY